MPAINLAILKTQAARLAENFSEPQVFVRALNGLLDHYTNRTIRAAQTAQRLSLPTYHTPAPVLRQILSEMASLPDSKPGEAVALTETLWDAGTLESRLLATSLLGRIPLTHALHLIARLPDWLVESTDKKVRTALLTDGFTRLRRENPEALFILLEDWLKSPRPATQVWGLQALIPILKDPHFENLPAIFRIVRPAFLSAGPLTQVDLQTCLATLEQVSLTETLAFLRDITRGYPPALMLRTLRRILPGLSPEMQTGLLDILREKGTK